MPVTFESSQTSVNRRKVVLRLFLYVTVVAVNKANATLDAGQSSARKSLPARPLTAAAERKRATSFTSDAYIACVFVNNLAIQAGTWVTCSPEHLCRTTNQVGVSRHMLALTAARARRSEQAC
ncbi:unnamed protein product [Trichogramma brassicae]|uniref:Uncharacterized protein n=1 Tax=Trichogramma brassicae TaxID=86971 RepID=A0A6H5I029_9HYME|nr:unnamed protein product [Trichogramma brassicae]